MRFTIQVQLEKCKIKVFRSKSFEVDKYCVREYTVKNLGRVSHRVGLMWPVHRHYPPFMLHTLPCWKCTSHNLLFFYCPAPCHSPIIRIAIEFYASLSNSTFCHLRSSISAGSPKHELSKRDPCCGFFFRKTLLLDQLISNVRRNYREKEFKKRKCVV